ncbi:MAG: phosphatase PAP2 family protein [Sphingobacteriales bacterium]|nr:MAG: phosphatase PAP2 family protein [Sphingobacteriales bacterium]
MHKNLIIPVFLILTFQTSLAQQRDSLILGQQKHLYSNLSAEPVEFKIAPIIIPAVLIGYGFAAVHNQGALKQLDVSTKDELQEDHPLFAAHVDDYVQFAPALAVYGLNLGGIKGKHSMADATFLYATSAAIMGLSTHFVKQAEHRLRPNGSAYNSFPSGHTASAFAAAEFLKQEYKDVSPWYGYAGYFVATATGTLRMYNNKHWFSDVVAGAGFGIVSTKISYFVYPYIRRLFAEKKTRHFTVVPFHQDGTNGIMLYGRF